jgi:hypothetical protein
LRRAADAAGRFAGALPRCSGHCRVVAGPRCPVPSMVGGAGDPSDVAQPVLVRRPCAGRHRAGPALARIGCGLPGRGLRRCHCRIGLGQSGPGTGAGHGRRTGCVATGTEPVCRAPGSHPAGAGALHRQPGQRDLCAGLVAQRRGTAVADRHRPAAERHRAGPGPEPAGGVLRGDRRPDHRAGPGWRLGRPAPCCAGPAAGGGRHPCGRCGIGRRPCRRVGPEPEPAGLRPLSAVAPCADAARHGAEPVRGR